MSDCSSTSWPDAIVAIVAIVGIVGFIPLVVWTATKAVRRL